MGETAEFIIKYQYAIISALGAVIAAMAIYIKRIHSMHSKEQKDSIKLITEAMLNNKASIDSNTKVSEQLVVLLHQIDKRI